MKTSVKALLIGLIVASAGPALAQATAVGTPIKMLEADVSSPGKGSFSGLGTGTFRNQSGTSQSVNVGMSSNILATTSADSSPDYASTGSVSATITDGTFGQTFGVVTKVLDNVATQTEGGNSGSSSNVANDMITGNFVGSFATSGDFETDTTVSDVVTDTQDSTSNVDLAGVSSKAMVDLDGSSITLQSGARTLDTAAKESGQGSASGNIATSTAATATVTSSAFSSGFMQTFSPASAVQAGVVLPAPAQQQQQGQ